MEFREIQKSVAQCLLWIQHFALWVVSGLLFDSRYDKREPQTILVLRTCLLGDFLFSIPALAMLRATFRQAKIVFLSPFLPSQRVLHKAAGYLRASTELTLPWFGLIKEGIVDDFLVLDSMSWTRIRSMRTLIRRMAVDRCVILTHPTESFWGLLKKLLFLRLIGVGCGVYGWKTRANHNFMRKAQREMNLFEHHVIGPVRAVRDLSGDAHWEVTEIEFPLKVDPKAKAEVENLWAVDRLVGRSVVAVAPGATQPHKSWPIDKFVQLCLRLAEHWDVCFIVVGTKEHQLLGERLVSTPGLHGANLAGRTSLPMLGEVLKRVVVLVGNDGGAVQLAASLGRRCVSIISGIEYPGSVDPWGSQDLSVRNPVSCSPCYSFTHCPEGHNRCMLEISVQDVFRNCCSVLETADVHRKGNSSRQ